MKYTTNQRAAIEEIDRNLQIIACAGSGKTQVISARIVEILRRRKADGIGPENIVAFTFTEKAAAELKDRIYRLASKQLGSTQGFAEMFVGTIHAYCLQLLQSPPLYDYLKYRVLSEVQQRLFVDRHSSKSGLTKTPLLAGGNLRRWADSYLFVSILGLIGEGQADAARVPQGVLEAYAAYGDHIDDKNLLDYTAIIAHACAALREEEELKSAIQQRVKYLVVDEYQDVNPLQELLVRLHADLGANLCVVGDDDQTIYQWRGSRIENIRGFADRYEDVRAIPLNENFRSSNDVVDVARDIVEANQGRLPKKMVGTAAQQGERGDVLMLDFTTPDDEAEWIAQKIASMLGTAYRDRPDKPERGLAFSDFAVLLRTVKSDGTAITDALEAAGIPFIVKGMNRLFETAEIRALRVVFQHLGDVSTSQSPVPNINTVVGALRSARLGVTDEALKQAETYLTTVKQRLGRVMDAKLYLQRVYLDLLQHLDLREEAVGEARGRPEDGEVVFYNLGKFSQLIVDYEQVHFNSAPESLYPSFAQFLIYQAPNYYPEGWVDAGYADPNAVNVMTVHQAKGMQWPVVFVPALRRNRFPSRRQGGRQWYHVIPESAVDDPDSLKGTVEDERRLFYVALTRAERYLFCSWSPVPGNRQQQRKSQFCAELTRNNQVLTREPLAGETRRLPPAPRHDEANVVLSFSELKYFFECPYQFKLRFLYGFAEPLNRALGYGKSLHDMLAEIHAEALAGRIPDEHAVPGIVNRHLNLPFANNQIRQHLEGVARDGLERYLRRHKEDLDRLEHVEKVVEVNLGDGVVVNGRIDLIRRTDRDETTIVDFKSKEDVQKKEITLKQLHIYGLGYEELTGDRADLLEIHNIDEGGSDRAVIDEAVIDDTRTEVLRAGEALRTGSLCRPTSCGGCELRGICRTQLDRLPA